MKVRIKLVISFTAIVVLLWLIAIFAVDSFGNSRKQFSTVEEDIIPDTIAMTEVETLSHEIYREVSDYLFLDIEEAKRTALLKLRRLEEIGLTYLPTAAMPGMIEHGKDCILAGKIFDYYFSTMWTIDVKERGADYARLVERDRSMDLPALLAMQEQAGEVKAASIAELTRVKTEYDRAYTSGLHSLFSAAGFLTLLAIAAAILTTRSIVEPLLALRKGTEVIAQGNLDYKVGTEAGDEIGELSRAFDKMTQSLSTSMTSIDNLNQEIAERKRAEEALRESEEKFSVAFRSSPNSIAITTIKDGIFLEINDSFTRDNGYTREEVIGRSSEELNLWVNPKERERITKILRDKGRVVNQEYSSRLKSGEIHTMLFSAEPINIAGEACILAVTTDITERKKTEEALKESEEKFSKAFHASPDAISISTLSDGTFLEVNESYTRILGYTREELIGNNANNLNIWANSEQRDMMLQKMSKRIKMHNEEFEFRSKSGEIRTMLFSCEYVQIGGEPCTLAVSTDITERKKSEEKQQAILETALDGFWMCNLEGKILEVNESYCKITGYTREELLEMSIQDIEAVEKPGETGQHIKKIVENGSDRFETQHKRKDGKIIDIEISVNYLNIDEGQLCVFVRDITERRQAEEALKEREKRFSDIVENTLEWIWEVDTKGKYIYSNPVVEKILGYKSEEILEKHFYDFFLSEERKELKKAVFEAFAQKQPIKEFINRNRCRDGKTVELLTSGVPVIDEEGNLLGYRGVDTDITERKRAEEALRESEEKFSIAFRSSPNTMAITTVNDGKFIEVNNSHTLITGYTLEEIIGHTSTELNFWAKAEDRIRMLQILKEQGRVYNEEFEFRIKSGEIRNWLFSAEKLTIRDAPCIISITVDITERKRAEKLQQDENYVLTLMGQGAQLSEVLEAIVRLGESYNPAIKGSVLLYDSSKELLLPAAAPNLPAGYNKLMENGIPIGPNLGTCGTAAYSKERVIAPDIENSTLFPKEVAEQAIAYGLFACWSQPILSSTGELLGTIANYSEKTGEPEVKDLRILEWSAHIAAIAIERKRAEEALRESEEKFSIAFRSSPNTMAITTVNDGKFIEVNNSHTLITGYTLEEIIGHTSTELNFWAKAEDRIRMLQILKEQGRVYNEEFEFRIKSGEIRNWLFSAEKLTIRGEPCIISITVDITERKRAEKWQLDENHVLTLMGQGAQLSEVLDAIVRLGESHDPSIKGSMLLYDSSKELLLPAAAPNLPTGYNKLMENGIPIGPNLGTCGTAAYSKERVIAPDIENSTLFPKEVAEQAIAYGLFACWSQPILSSTGELLGTIANYSEKTGEPEVKDLRVLEWSAHIAAIAIERKRAEEALKESEEFSTSLLENAPNPIEVINPDTLIKYVNPAFEKLTGFAPDDLTNIKAPYPWWPEESWTQIKARQKETMKSGNSSGEQIFQKKNGERFWVAIDALSVIKEGKLKYLLINWSDITERKRAEEVLRLSDAAFRSIHESVIVTDLDGNITHWNEISEQLFGIKASEAIGKKFLEVIEIVEAYPGETQDRIKNIKKQGHWEDERIYRTRKGDIWVDVRLQDIVDNGVSYGRVMLASDITQRKHAEEKLKQALSDLEHSNVQFAATNKELETFSYSVSHDLRSPLRSIDGFSQALMEDYHDKLDETGHDYLERLRNASQKMGELIDGLLRLSRLTRSEMHKERVDLSTLGEEIAARLQETRPGRRAKFIIDKGLNANGDPQLLRVLVENLLSNAWKFTRKKQQAKIEFGTCRNNGKQTFFVKDNGAGFDMSYTDKLFGAFQRLHDSTEFPGTGIGLATVQRIINRHGGTIRAEGAVGKGATFYFTLD